MGFRQGVCFTGVGVCRVVDIFLDSGVAWMRQEPGKTGCLLQKNVDNSTNSKTRKDRLAHEFALRSSPTALAIRRALAMMVT